MRDDGPLGSAGRAAREEDHEWVVLVDRHVGSAAPGACVSSAANSSSNVTIGAPANRSQLDGRAGTVTEDETGLVS